MAKLSISDAARVAGVARSTLYRAIQTGRLSADPDGRLDTAELLRAGYTLQRSAQQTKDGALHDAPPRNTDAQQSSAPTETQALHVMQQERDMLRLERDMLRQQLTDAQAREQAAREREARLLQMLQQMQHRYDRMLDLPRASPQEAPGSTQARRRVHSPALPARALGDARGTMRRRILALLQDHPEGLTTQELRDMLGVERSLADTCLGMRRYGLVQRVERGRYVATARVWPAGE